MSRPPLLALMLGVSILALAATLPALAANEEDPAAAFRADVHREVMLARRAHDLTPATITDDQIVASMKRAIDYLFKNKTKDNWESVDSWSQDPKEGEMKGGETALVLLALLEAGQSINDPRLNFRSPELAPVVDYVAKLQTDRTYVLGMQASALALLPQVKDLPYHAALTRIEHLLVAAVEQNPAYGYSVKKENNAAMLPEEMEFTIPHSGKPLKFIWKWDNSNSQYALLGVWSAADAGVAVPQEYWALEDSLWRGTQCRDGAWCYDVPVDHASMARYYGTNEVSTRELPATSFQRPTMTAAGLASLYVTQEFLDTEVRLEPKPDPAIVNGLKNFADTLDPCFADGYYLYGIERVALASGYKYFGDFDWYRELACTLLATQQDSGAWQYHMNVGVSPNVGTAYGLLTLARGRNPVLFNKLEYDGPWNARPRDNANLTHWMSKTFERPLNWQIVTLKVPGDEWLDAPILMITGSKDPHFTAEQLAKIKAFINGGGMVFSTADGGSEIFTNAMKKYAVEVTNRLYEMRVLPKDHPIFNIFYDIKAPPTIWALSNGSRELWVHTTLDMGAAWQRKNVAMKAAFEVPANIFFYASGRGKLRPRLQPLTPIGGAGEEKKTVALGRVEYAGNWDPEPGAWPRFAAIAKARWATAVQVVTVKPDALDPAKTPVVHLTGTAKFTLTDGQIAGLKNFLQKGGRICFDACGGSPAFNESAQEIIKTIDLGPIQPLLPNDPLFAGNAPNTEAIAAFEYRGPVIQRLQRKPEGPLLQGVKIADRLAILLSAEDLSSGLLGSHTWLPGYDPDTALAILRNFVLESSVDK